MLSFRNVNVQPNRKPGSSSERGRMCHLKVCEKPGGILTRTEGSSPTGKGTLVEGVSVERLNYMLP